MGWSIGYDNNWHRDIGYGVPSVCDYPNCNEKIDRGLSYVCGEEPYGGEKGCGLFFCGKHKFDLCERCENGEEPFEAKPDTKEWIRHKITDESWEEWRKENPNRFKELLKLLEENNEV